MSGACLHGAGRARRHPTGRALGGAVARISATVAVGLLVALAVALPSRADEVPGASPTPADRLLASRLSAADTAGEYWDVTAWFDSGERFFGRFLVTNQGPGERSAAAVGDFITADGTIVPFKWGRRDGDWTLDRDGRRLAIGKATLDVSGPAIVVRIDSKKHGVDLGLEIDAGNGVVGFPDREPSQAFAVAMPAAARGALNADDPSKARTLVGSAAVVHRWGDRPESESVRRRDELFARRGDVALYLAATTWADGTRRTAFDLRRAGRDDASMDAPALELGSESLPNGDTAYPVARAWRTTLPSGFVIEATLARALLRMNPLDVLPQPFRFILALGGTPQRVWAGAKLRLARGDEIVELDGIASTSFARPER